jgi:hypothetical protein
MLLAHQSLSVVLFPDFVLLAIPEFCEDNFRSALKLAMQFPLILLFWNYTQHRYVFGKVHVLEQLTTHSPLCIAMRYHRLFVLNQEVLASEALTLA